MENNNGNNKKFENSDLPFNNSSGISHYLPLQSSQLPTNINLRPQMVSQSEPASNPNIPIITQPVPRPIFNHLMPQQNGTTNLLMFKGISQFLLVLSIPPPPFLSVIPLRSS